MESFTALPLLTTPLLPCGHVGVEGGTILTLKVLLF